MALGPKRKRPHVAKAKVGRPTFTFGRAPRGVNPAAPTLTVPAPTKRVRGPAKTVVRGPAS